jgi:predicted RNA-binding protein with PIN domain
MIRSLNTHYLLVDGYNIIHAREELAAIAEYSLHGARQRLCDAMCEFKALSSFTVIVVFDAHLVEGGIGSVETYHNITVVFTKEAETADHYIERAAHTLARRDKVTVATSDALEQIIIIGQGARRITATDLWGQIEQAREAMQKRYLHNRPIKKNPIASLLDEETAKQLDALRYTPVKQASCKRQGIGPPGQLGEQGKGYGDKQK